MRVPRTCHCGTLLETVTSIGQQCYTCFWADMRRALKAGAHQPTLYATGRVVYK